MDTVNEDVKESSEGDHQEMDPSIEISEHRTEKFSKDELGHAWKEFASFRRKNGKAQEQHIFVQPYDLEEDGSTISLELSNPLQEDILEEIKSDLVQFLRNKLENDSIMVETRLRKENGKKMLYTNREKLDHIADKNPVVKDLQKKLGLDPEY